MTTSVVIVGGGIAAAAAAFELTTSHRDDLRIDVITGPSLGGALQSTSVDDRHFDLGADGFLAKRPEARDFICDLGLGNELVDIAASGAWIYLDGQLNAIPTGMVLGVPTSLAQLRAVPALSRAAMREAWRDRFLPRRLSLPDGDVAIGQILRHKFGDHLTHEIIEPMLGGIHAGRVDELSAATVFPQLLTAARAGGSLMAAIAPPATPASPGPAFQTLRGTMGSLAPRAFEILEGRGVSVRRGVIATKVRRTTAATRPFEVDTEETATPADAVVVALGPRPLGQVAGHLHPHVARLADTPSASVAMVTFIVPAADVNLPESGTGVLIPLLTPYRESRDSFISTAVTFLDRKWPHVARPHRLLVRVHCGRIDDSRIAGLSDDELTRRVESEMAQLFGAWPRGSAVTVQRWTDALPQYRVGHGDLVAAARAAVQPEGIFLAGMLYDGVGIPASIGSGRRAARELLARLPQ